MSKKCEHTLHNHVTKLFLMKSDGVPKHSLQEFPRKH